MSNIAEQAVIGALLSDPDVWGKLESSICEKDFLREDHRQIFRAIGNLNAADKPVDLITVSEELESNGKLDNAGGLKYLGDLLKNSFPANVESQAAIVREHARKHRLAEICQLGLQQSQLYGSDETIQTLMESLENLAHQKIGNYQTFNEVLLKGLVAIDEANMRDSSGEVTGVPIGIPELDRRMSGLRKSKLVVIAARPSVGKTTIVHNIALHAAMNGHAGAIFSLEMSDEELAIRSFAHEYQVNGTALSFGDNDAISELKKKAVDKNIKNYPLFIDTETFDLNGILTRATELHRKHNIKFVVVDHIGLVETDANNTNDKIGKISRALKKLSKKLDIPVLAVSQLNRKVEEQKRRPKLSDLRDSGSIEQDCDIAIFLHVAEEDEGKEVLPIEIGILKHRGGRKGWIDNVQFRFFGRTQTIREVADAC